MKRKQAGRERNLGNLWCLLHFDEQNLLDRNYTLLHGKASAKASNEANGYSFVRSSKPCLTQVSGQKLKLHLHPTIFDRDG